MEGDWLSQYKEVKPEELETKPFTFYHEDWCLITAGDETKCNSMTISWGAMGTYMSKPITNIYIRKPRYTKEFFDKFDYFSVCQFSEKYKETLSYMGRVTGRDEDKYAKSGLKPIKFGNTMAIEQADKIIICRKMYSGVMDPRNITPCETRDKIYDLNNPDDCHSMYMGEVEKILIRK